MFIGLENLNISLLETFSGIGLCFIIKYGSILNFIREPLKKITFFNKLLSCALCLGFHIGFWPPLLGHMSIGYAFLSAFYFSAICWLADYITMVSDNIILTCQKYNSNK